MSLNQLLSTKWYPFLFDASNKTDLARTILFWTTIALAVAFVLSILLVKKENREKLLKIFLPIAIAYSCVVAAIFLYFGFKEDGIVKILFVPLLVMIVVTAACGVTLCFKRSKPVLIACVSAFFASLLAVLICMGVYFGSGDVDWAEITKNKNIALYVSAILSIAIILALAYVFGKNDRKSFDSKSIAYAAVCIAMSFALSYIRIVKLPQGGSVTLASLLPLMIYSYMFGTKKGVFAGFIYGVLQAIQDPWIVHPMQFLLDYPIAFSAIGLAGMFAKIKLPKELPQVNFALGALAASVLRFMCHVLSGVFAFASYAGDENVLVYSLGYNSFVFADIAISIVVGVMIFSSKSFMKQISKYNEQ